MSRAADRILRAALCALLVGAAVGCQSDAQKLESLLKRSEASIEAGNYKEAVIDLRSALQLAPQNADVNLRLARVLVSMKQSQNAVFFFEEAFRLDPSLDEARLGAARILTTSDPERAEQLLDEVLKRDPGNARAVSARANLQLVKKDTAGALESALLATQLAPDDRVAWTQLGRVYQAQVQLAMSQGKVPPDATYTAGLAAFDKARDAAKGDAESAETMVGFERARLLAAWPHHASEAKEAYLELLESTHGAKDPKRFESARSAALYFAGASGDPAIAREILEKLNALDPAYIWTWTLLATVEQSQGGSAAAVYDRLVQARPKDARAHIARADQLRREGRSADAAQDLLVVVTQVDEPNRLRGYLVDLYDELGRKDEATAMLTRLEQDAPDSDAVRIAQGTRALREQRPADAVKILEPLLGTTTEAGVAMILAEAQLRVRNLPAATASLDRAVELAGGVLPDSQRIRFAIARAGGEWNALLRIADEMARSGARLTVDQEISVAEALYEVGQDAQARERLGAIVARDNPTVRARVTYMQREGKRDPARARQLLEEGLKQQPGSPELVRALTMLDLSQDQSPAAMARLDAAIDAQQGSPNSAYLRLLRGRLRLAAGDAAGAQADALAAFRSDPQRPDVAEFLAEVAIRRGQPTEAIDALEAGAREGALSRASRTVLARLYGAAGRDDDAIKLLEGVVADGGGSIAKNELAYLLAKQGRDLDRAITLAREVVGVDASKSAFVDTLGYAYLQNKLYAQALAQFDHAIDLASDEKQPQAQYHYRRGLALQGLGRTEDARKAFEAALSLDPGFSDAQHARASLEEPTTATP